MSVNQKGPAKPIPGLQLKDSDLDQENIALKKKIIDQEQKIIDQEQKILVL